MPDRFDRFTEHARRVLQYAQEEALGYYHNYIGPEHILFGVLRELRARLALIEARLQAVERREEIVELIGGSANPRQAERRLRELLDLSSEQAHFVLELPWGELTKAAVERMRQERDDLRAMLESEQP